MTLDDLIERDVSRILAPGAGLVKTIKYNGDYVDGQVSSTETQADREGGGKQVEANLVVKVSQVATSAYRDVVVIDGVTWMVKSTVKEDGHTRLVRITRDERPRVR